MKLSRKKVLVAGTDSARLIVAVIFLVLAGFTALAHGAERSVEGLDYDSITVWGGTEVEITQVGATGLTMRGDADDLDKVPFYIRGDTLYLGRSEAGSRLGAVKFRVSVADLRELAVKGSGEVYVKPLDVKELELSVEGSGDIYLHKLTVARDLDMKVAGSGNIWLAEITAAEVSIEVSGSGGVEFGELKSQSLDIALNGSGDVKATRDGETDDVDLAVVGSGDVDISRVRAGAVDVAIMGSGDASVWAERELDTSIMGSGDVSYRGDPQTRSSILGSGNMERLD